MMLGVACSNNANPAPNNGCDEDPSIAVSCGGKNFCTSGCIEDYTPICGNQTVIGGISCSCSSTIQGNELIGKYCAL